MLSTFVLLAITTAQEIVRVRSLMILLILLTMNRFISNHLVKAQHYERPLPPRRDSPPLTYIRHFDTRLLAKVPRSVFNVLVLTPAVAAPLELHLRDETQAILPGPQKLPTRELQFLSATGRSMTKRVSGIMRHNLTAAKRRATISLISTNVSCLKRRIEKEQGEFGPGNLNSQVDVSSRRRRPQQAGFCESSGVIVLLATLGWLGTPR